MTARASVRRRMCRLAAVLGAVAYLAAMVTPAQASTFVPLNGDGSSWAEPAIDQWGEDVRGRGIVVNFSGDGSAAGRSNYTLNQADFAASDIPFLSQGDPFGGSRENPTLAYSYVPIVAGGTAFMYNLVVGGRKITNLRLSGDTLTKIFTGQIKNWNDPRIAHDYGAPLPSQPITVVTRSDGSGATYQFTRWMSKQYSSQWNAFCAAHGGPNPCGPTEFYPGFTGSQQRGGSDQVANYISSSSYGEGAIGYDEYAYALNSNIPVVKLLNAAGYYTLPTASNVAIALQKATIDNNPASLTYLIQNLDAVYTNPDPRAYPLSSYSYLIVPRASRVINGSTYLAPPRFNNAKGATLSTWLNYVLCGAQQKAGSLGYSPLPKNLVVGGFLQTDNIPGHVATPNLAQLNGCDNPTYHDGVNYLVRDAPQPSPCDKSTAPLTCGSSSTGSTSTGNGGGSNGSGGSGAGGGTTGAGGSTGSQSGGTQTRSGTAAPAATRVDPDTGRAVTVQGTDAAAGAVYAEPVSVQGGAGGNGLFGVLTACELIAAVSIPPLLGGWLRRRRKSP